MSGCTACGHISGFRRDRYPAAAVAILRAAAMIAFVAVPFSALAQDAPAEPVIANATLPRDLSPWGMFLSADPLVKGVLIGLTFASVVTWTVWLAKTIELFVSKPRGGAPLG